MVERIQNWYILNCDGDWEHQYGYSITTLDNPGWGVKIDLSYTPLENLEFDEEFQSTEDPQNWYSIHTKNNVLEMFCGPNNLEQIFTIFFDKIIPQFASPDFKYEIYLPLVGHHYELWTPATAIMVNERSVKILDIQSPKYKQVKFRNIDDVDFTLDDLDKMFIPFKKGDVVEFQLEEVFDGVILTASHPKV